MHFQQCYPPSKDPIYRSAAWDIFQAFNRYARVESGGYSGLKDVTNPSGGMDDTQQTFWLAETLKCAPDNWTGLGCATPGLKPLQAMRLHRRSCAGRDAD